MLTVDQALELRDMADTMRRIMHQLAAQTKKLEAAK